MSDRTRSGSESSKQSKGETKSIPEESSSEEEREEDLSEGKKKTTRALTTDSYALEIKVAEGRNLAAKDKSGTSDPYCSLKLEKLKVKTKVISKTLNPKWNEIFTMPVLHSDKSSLIVTCWDKDLVGKDFMGTITIPVSKIKQQNRLVSEWFPLETNKKKEEVSGEILLHLEFKETTRETMKSESKEKAVQKFNFRFPEVHFQEKILQVFQGRLHFSGISIPGSIYVSENWICFYSHRLGKTRKQQISIVEIKTMEKEHSMLMVPNSISISTQDGKSFWFSQLSDRSKMFDLISVQREVLESFKSTKAEQSNSLPVTKKRSKSNEKKVSRSSSRDEGNNRDPILIVKVKFMEEEKDYVELSIDTSKRVYSAVQTFCSHFGIASEEQSSYSLTWKKKDKKKNSKSKIKMEPQKLISYYDLPEKAALILSKPEKKGVQVPSLPFRNFQEKFKVEEGRGLSLPYEFGYHCAEFPILLEDSNESFSYIAETALKKGLGIEESTFEEIKSRANSHGPGIESILIELDHRFTQVDSHPYYNRKNFKSMEEYELWWKKERNSIVDIANRIVLSDNSFLGTLFLKVVEAENLAAKDMNGFSDPYVIMTINTQRAKTKTKKKTLSPVWNENFEFSIPSPNDSLQIEIYDRDLISSSDFISRLTIPVTDMINSASIDKWYDLEPKGRLHIEIKFEHPYGKYIHKFVDIMKLVKHPSSSEGIDRNDEEDYVAAALLKAKRLQSSGEKNENNKNHDSDKNIVEGDPSYSKGIVNHNRFFHQISKALLDFQLREMENSLTNEKILAYLEEYSDRFGVTWFYSRVMQLYNLESVFSPSADQIFAVEELLVEIAENRSNEIATLFEERIYRKTCEKLWIHVEEIIKCHGALFPKNKPAGAVSSLCEIVGLLCNNREDHIVERIRSCLQISIEEKYEEMLSRCRKWHPDSSSNGNREGLNCEQILKLCDMIEEEILAESAFRESFPSAVQLVSFTTNWYLELFFNELKVFCEEETKTEAFEVYFKVKKLQKTIYSLSKKEAASKLVELEKLFVPFVLVWLKETATKLGEWVENAFKMDQKTTLSDSVLHSSSVMDTFTAIFSAMEFLKSLEMRDPFFILNFTEVVCKTAKKFTTKQLELFRSDLGPRIEPKQKAHKRSATRNSDSAPTFHINSGHCISLNNVEGARTEMDKFANLLEEQMDKFESSKMVLSNANQGGVESGSAADLFERGTFETCIQEAFAVMRKDRDSMIESLYEKMRPLIQYEFNLATQKGSEIQKLLDYLDEQLSVLSDNLYPSLFKIVLKSIWISTLKDLRSQIFPSENAGALMTLEEAKKQISTLKKLQDFFHADGSGLSKEMMTEQTATLEKLLGLYETPTRELIVIYTQLKNSNQSQNTSNVKGTTVVSTIDINRLEGIEFIHPKQILEGRKDDKIAQAFLQEAENPELHKKQQEIRSQFLLSESELILETYKVTMDTTPGILVLSTSYLLFDSVFSKSADSQHQIAIPLTEIKKIDKDKFALILEHLIVFNQEDEKFVFSAYSCKTMEKDIIHYASLAGNKHLSK
eukprot:TRINITY_DN2579_c0_g3_i1.p1 TRINITY_DN2579_c0_g3~~TRINITY_DN2579_c0_g3_i1.p1  ORF type:complete len:1547 (-),score=508.88 TRINITY_DN2579_c0_g3_i1:59-4699(-)